MSARQPPPKHADARLTDLGSVGRDNFLDLAVDPAELPSVARLKAASPRSARQRSRRFEGKGTGSPQERTNRRKACQSSRAQSHYLFPSSAGGQTLERTLNFLLGSAALLALAVSPAGAEPNPVKAPEVVTALEQAYGVHPGQRRNHTKGMCAEGSFVGAPEIAAYSRSALFTGATIPVVARFSLAGGNPEASDTEKSPRGMALEFQLADGSRQHMTMLNTPMFFATMPH
jgi:Catalase